VNAEHDHAEKPLAVLGSGDAVSRIVGSSFAVLPIIAAGAAVVAVGPGDVRDRTWAGIALLVLTLIRATATTRGLSRWLQIGPSLPFAAVVGALTAVTQEPIYGVLLLFSVLRIALAEDLRMLLMTFAATLVALLVPAILHPSELAAPAVLWALLLPIIGFPAQYLARSLAERVRLAARLRTVVTAVLAVDDARDAIVHAALDLGAADVVVLIEPRASGELAATAYAGGDLGDLTVARADASIIGQAFARRQPLFAPNVAGVAGALPPALGGEQARSALSVPVVRGRRVAGVLCVLWRTRVRRPDDPRVEVLQLLAAEAAVAIERADLLQRLSESATRDPLTGLGNRRAWDTALEQSMAESLRSGRPLTIALIDLDRFKAFNDAEGHRAGDRLLREAASLWTAALRERDVLARWGGEEFTLLLPDCDEARAMEVVERLRAVVPAGQTASAGVGCWNGRESGAALFERVDSALYAAKASGRDRIVRAAGVA